MTSKLSALSAARHWNLAAALEARGARWSGIGLPSPRPWTPFGSEHLATLQRQRGHHGLGDAQTCAEDVVYRPVALLDFQHRNIRLPPGLEAAQTIGGADGPGRIGRTHRDHLIEREPEAEKARHHLGHTVHRADSSRHGEVGADAMRQQALVDDSPADVEAEVRL